LPGRAYEHNIKTCSSLSDQQIRKFAAERRLFDEHLAVYNPKDHSVTYFTKYRDKFNESGTRQIFVPEYLSRHGELLRFNYQVFDLTVPYDFDHWIAARFATYKPRIESVEIDGSDSYFVITYENGGREFICTHLEYLPFFPPKYVKYVFDTPRESIKSTPQGVSLPSKYIENKKEKSEKEKKEEERRAKVEEMKKKEMEKKEEKRLTKKYPPAKRAVVTPDECDKCSKTLTKAGVLKEPQTVLTDEQRGPAKEKFKDWAFENHPDKGGDTDVFQEVSHCTDIIVKSNDCSKPRKKKPLALPAPEPKSKSKSEKKPKSEGLNRKKQLALPVSS